MLKQLNLLLKLLIVVGYYELLRALVLLKLFNLLLKLMIVEAVVVESVFEAVESLLNLLITMLKLLIVVDVESVVVEAVDCW